MDLLDSLSQKVWERDNQEASWQMALFPRGRGCFTRWTMGDEFDSERFPGNFYQGMILRLDRARGRGIVRSHSGREVEFEFPYVLVIGAGLGGRMPGIELLSEGDVIGFDVGWTSKGLRVTTLRPRSGAGHPRER